MNSLITLLVEFSSRNVTASALHLTHWSRWSAMWHAYNLTLHHSRKQKKWETASRV